MCYKSKNSNFQSLDSGGLSNHESKIVINSAIVFNRRNHAHSTSVAEITVFLTGHSITFCISGIIQLCNNLIDDLSSSLLSSSLVRHNIHQRHGRHAFNDSTINVLPTICIGINGSTIVRIFTTIIERSVLNQVIASEANHLNIQTSAIPAVANGLHCFGQSRIQSCISSKINLNTVGSALAVVNSGHNRSGSDDITVVVTGIIIDRSAVAASQHGNSHDTGQHQGSNFLELHSEFFLLMVYKR